MLAPLILLAHSDPPSNDPLWRRSGFKCININTASCSTVALDHGCGHQISTVFKPQMLSTVVNWVRLSELVVNNHRPFHWQRLWYDAKVEQMASYSSGDILVLMPPPRQTGRRMHYVLDLSVRPYVCPFVVLPYCEHDILKTSILILIF